MELTLDELVLVNCTHHLGKKAVVYDDGTSKRCMTYQELLHMSSKLTAYLSKQFTPGEVIGLCLKSDQYIPVILLSVLRCHTVFYNMDRDSADFTSHVLEEIGARFIIVHKEFLKKLKEILSSRRTLTELPINCLDSYVMLKCESQEARLHPPGLAYCITTSGTTGRPKIVQVPHACIVPNITHLREMFCIVPNDLVLLTSPMTFDPSIVEIFMTLTSGACLLIVPESIKMTPDLLLSTIHLHNQVTVIQLTPTLLLRFNIESILATLLGDNSVLRVMALGGEKFPPSSYIRKIKSSGNRTRLFDLYGTTEVSCWSTCYEVKEEDIRSADNIPLGPCLNNTSLEVRDPDGKVITEGVGELFIGGTMRQCIIGQEEMKDCENGLLMRATGDIVEIKADHQIYYIGRRDRQTKRNGKRIDLEEIKLVASQLEYIQQCEVMLIENRLVVFAAYITVDVSPKSFVTTASDVIKKHLAKNLPSHSVPDRLVIVNSLPMTKHGKVNLKELKDIYTEECSNKFSVDPLEFLVQRWKEILGHDSPIADDANFISQGGNSLKALHLLNDLEHVLNRNLPELLDIILQKTFVNIKEYLNISRYKTDLSPNSSKEIHKEIDPKETSLVPYKNISLDIKKDYINLKKEIAEGTVKHTSDGCKRKQSLDMKDSKLFKVDTAFSVSISRGSRITRTTCADGTHTPSEDVIDEGYVCLEAGIPEGLESDVQLIEKWRYDTGKCVDASPLLAISRNAHDSDIVFIGSHSHTMCAIRLCDGEKQWEITLPDRIESSACLSLCGHFVIVGCYDGKVYCLKASSGDLWWSHDTGSNVKSSPIVDRVTGLVYIGSHSQALFCLDVVEREVKWEKCLQSGSIFSSPAICYDPHYVCVGTLGGKVFALSADSGEVLWKINLGKPVFSSLAVCQTGVCVGCTDNRLYFLSHTGQQIWNFSTEGPIFSSPVTFFIRHPPDDARKRCKQNQHEVPKTDIGSNDGEQFIIFGCHDNCVYCLTMQGGVVWKVKTDSSVYSTPFVRNFSLDNSKNFLTINRKEEEDLSNGCHDNQVCSCHHCFNLGNCVVRNSDHQGENLRCNLSHNFRPKSCKKAIDIHSVLDNQIGSNPVTAGASIASMSGTQGIVSSIGCDINVMEPGKSKARIPVVVFSSSKGTLYIVHAVTGQVLCTKALPYEVFSSAVVYDNTIVVGCRDNYVYGFKVH